MPIDPQPTGDFSLDEDGNVAVTVSLMMTVLMGFAALGVDAAALYRVRAELQSISDLTAMSAVADPAAGASRAFNALSRNGKPAESLVTFEPGRYLRNPALSLDARFQTRDAGDADINAVRVALTEDAPLHFARVFTEAQSVNLSAGSIASRTGAASFSLTSHIARLDGAALNAALSQGFGATVLLTAGEVQVLADAQVDLASVLAELALLTGYADANPATILDQSFTAETIIAALQNVLSPFENAALEPVRLASAGLVVPISSLAGGIDSDLGLTAWEAMAELEMTALDMVRALAMVNLRSHQLDVSAALGVEGLLDASATVVVGGPAAQSGWIALGEKGVQLHRAAARVESEIAFAPDLLGALGAGVSVTQVNLPVVIEVAGATARLDQIDCAGAGDDMVARVLTAPTPLDPLNGTSVVALYLGALDPAAGDLIDPAALGFADVLELSVTVELPLLPDIVVDGIVVQARSTAAVGESQVQSITYSHNDLAEGDVTRHFGSGALMSTAVAGLLDPANTEVRVKPGQGGLISGVVGTVLTQVLNLLPQRLLSGLAAPLDQGLDRVLDTAGLSLGEGELVLTGHHCEMIRLVR